MAKTGGRGGRQSHAESRAAGGPFRDVYSPAILGDPSFPDQHRLNVEVLEQACRSAGHFCDEAGQARRVLTDLQQEH